MIMEIGALSSSSYLPPQFAENRVVRPVARDVSGTKDNLAGLGSDRKEDGKQNSVLPSSADAQKVTSNSKATETQVTQSTRTERENQQADQAVEARRTQQDVPIAAGGSIKLDVEDGNSVLKVFDSKDVLIYQLPPKGALMLIKAQESAQQSQVKTSA
jgi:hypothetical protein